MTNYVHRTGLHGGGQLPQCGPARYHGLEYNIAYVVMELMCIKSDPLGQPPGFLGATGRGEQHLGHSEISRIPLPSIWIYGVT